jgi:cyclopropane-fatty-acyl-phospholipid synthase
VNDALLDLVGTGQIPRETYERLVFPVYFRTAQELVEPVAGTHPDLAEVFRLDRVDSREVSVPFNERFEQTGNAPAYAREYTAFLRAFTEPIIRMTFSDQEQLDSLIETLYSRIEARLAEEPVGYAFHYIQVAALLTKQ